MSRWGYHSCAKPKNKEPSQPREPLPRAHAPLFATLEHRRPPAFKGPLQLPQDWFGEEAHGPFHPLALPKADLSQRPHQRFQQEELQWWGSVLRLGRWEAPLSHGRPTWSWVWILVELVPGLRWSVYFSCCSSSESQLPLPSRREFQLLVRINL